MGRNNSDNEEDDDDEHEVPMKGPAANNTTTNVVGAAETNDSNNNDSSFLDDDFLSFAHVDNGGENNNNAAASATSSSSSKATANTDSNSKKKLTNENNDNARGRKRDRPIDDKSSREQSRRNNTTTSPSIPWLDSSIETSSQHGRNNYNNHHNRGYNSNNHHRSYNNSNYYSPPLLKLHNEIVSFMELMSPTEHELKIRDDMVKRITQLAYRTFGSSERSSGDDNDSNNGGGEGGGGNNSNNGSGGGIQVLPFGSQVTGLCLPGSDIDFVIRLPKKKGKKKKKSNDDDGNKIDGKNSKTNNEEEEEEDEDDDQDWMTTTNPLEKFADAVKAEFGVRSELEIDDTHTNEDDSNNDDDNQREYLSYLEVITKTRVPLVKFTVEPYNLDIDICFDQPHGPESADLMHRFMESMPPLRPLTFCLKYFLASREINKPFTGGIGSYLLQLMIVSFLQHRSRSDLNRGYGGSGRHFNLGSLLLDFLELYGLDFNYVTTAISVRHDGYYFPKGQLDKKEYFWQPHRPMSIAVENPLDSTMDVGSGAYRIQMISRVFEHAFKTLLAYVSEPLEQSEDGSILARILPPTKEMEKRRALKEEIRNKKIKNDGGEGGEGAASAAGMDTKNGSSDVTAAAASSSEKQRGVKRPNNDKSKKSSSSSTNWDKHKKKNKNRDQGSKKRRHSGGSSSAGGSDGGGSSGGKWKNKNKKKRYSN